MRPYGIDYNRVESRFELGGFFSKICMTFGVLVILVVLNHIAYKGSKVLIALYAMELGAEPFTVGILFSLYSLFSLFIALYVGRMSDRLGARIPMLIGSIGLVCGLLLPYLLPRLVALYLSAAIIGTLYIFHMVAVQHLVGAFASGHERTRNFGLYSLGVGITSLLGPTVTGFSIDLFGHQWTYLLLAMLPAAAVAVLLAYFPRAWPRTGTEVERIGHRTRDLIGNVPLRRMLITAALIETGGELYNFYMPIYGHSIGLSASLIGMIIGTYAIALLLARVVMPVMSRKSSEEMVLFGSLALAAAACLVFPFITNVYMLAAISFVFGLGLGCCGPLSLIITYNRAPEGRSGEAMGLRQTVAKFTEASSPVVFGALGSAFGLAAAFWLVALLLAGGASIMQADAKQRTRRM